jgi:F-type H+-transporting ATPase subunit a
MSALHISISAETVGHVAGFAVSNSMISSLVVSGILLTFGLFVRASLRNTRRPSGLQNLIEFVIESLYSTVQSVTGDTKRSRQFFPLLATFFLFILLNNWFGLLPFVGNIGKLEMETAQTEHSMSLARPAQAHDGNPHVAESVTASTVPAHTETTTSSTTQTTATTSEAAHATPSFLPYFRAATADLNMTMALGLLSVVAIQYFGISYLKLGYFKKFFNFSSPILLIVGLLELALEMAKVVSFGFRLFGNVFAGEVLLVVITSLVPLILPMPLYGMELFVGFIQAVVFTMLSLVFFSMATHGHDEHAK